VKNSIIFETAHGKIEKAGDSLKNYIISRIDSGEFKPGMPLLSTQKLSHRFGVSLITAQKVLRELGNEHYLIRERGKRTIIGDVNSRKQDVSSKLAVGILFSGIDDNPFHAMLLSALFNYGLENNIKILSYTSQSDDLSLEKATCFLDKIKSSNIKYFIHNPLSSNVCQKFWAMVLKSGMTNIVLNDFWHGGGPFPCVRTQEERGHELVFEHLLALGHKRILLLDETRNSPRFYAEQAFKQAYMHHSLPFDESMVKYVCDARPSREIFYSDEMIDYIIDHYTAVYCTYDIYALRLCERLSERGIRVGKDISVAGFDNIPMAKSHKLTTVAHPIDQLVAKTFEMLFRGNHEQMCVCLPPKLILGSSTGKCPS